MDNEQDSNMRPIRGAVILCDQLYPSVNGKWVIAGTYTGIHVPVGKSDYEPPPLNLYIRFQVEHTGTYDCELLLIHKSLPSTAEPIIRQTVQIEVKEPHSPCELGCILPPFKVHCPKSDGVKPGQRIGVPLLLWLKVGENDVASCPLNVIFQPHKGTEYENDSSARPGPGTNS